jgi:hypothetical protein
MLFHEALHGKYGLSDFSLQEKFGLPLFTGGSENITFYVQQYVFGKAPGVCGN